MRFLFFFFFFLSFLAASFLVELETIVMVVVRWVLFCGCGLIFLGSCGLILVVVAVEELAVGSGSGSGGGLYEVVVAVVGFIILF